jgi:hypothetical protein
VVVSEPILLLTWLTAWELLPEQAVRMNTNNIVLIVTIVFFIVKSPEYAFFMLSLPTMLIV